MLFTLSFLLFVCIFPAASLPQRREGGKNGATVKMERNKVAARTHVRGGHLLKQYFIRTLKNLQSRHLLRVLLFLTLMVANCSALWETYLKRTYIWETWFSSLYPSVILETVKGN